MYARNAVCLHDVVSEPWVDHTDDDRTGTGNGRHVAAHRADAGTARAGIHVTGGRRGCGASGQRPAGTGRGPDRPAGGRAGPRARDDPDRDRGPGVVARGDAEPARGLHGGDGGGRLPCAAAQRHRVGGAGRRAVGHRPRQPGRGRSEGPASHHHPVVQHQHAADQRRLDGGPPRHAPQPGPGPHAGADQRQAPAPLVDSRLARRQRRGVRLAGPRHLGHPRDCAAAGRGIAGRRGGAVRLGRHRRGDELPAQGRPRRRLGRVEHRDVPGRRRRIDAVRGQRRPAAGRHRFRQPEPGIRQREPDEPGRTAARCDSAHRRRQHARILGPSAGLGRPGRRRRPEGVRQLRLHPARRRSDVRPHELRPQEGQLRHLLPQPEHAPRGVQQRPRPHAAGRRRAGGQRHGLGQLSDGRRHRPRAGPGRASTGGRRPELLHVPGAVPRRLHPADGRHGNRSGPRRRRARLHGRRLQLGPERLARDAPHRFLHPRHHQRLARPRVAQRVRRRQEPATGRQCELRRLAGGHRPGEHRGRRGVARRAVRPAGGRPRGVDGRPVRGAALHGGLERGLRLQPAAGGRLEPPQRCGLRRPGGNRHGRGVDAGGGGPHRGLRGLRNDDQRQGVGAASASCAAA